MDEGLSDRAWLGRACSSGFKSRLPDSFSEKAKRYDYFDRWGGRRFPLVTREAGDRSAQVVARRVHVALRDVELRVPGEKTHRFDAGAAADEGRAEVVAQRVERPRADAELLLEALERAEDALARRRLPALVHDDARVRHLETHGAFENGPELGCQRHHPLLAGLRWHDLVG